MILILTFLFQNSLYLIVKAILKHRILIRNYTVAEVNLLGAS